MVLHRLPAGTALLVAACLPVAAQPAPAPAPSQAPSAPYRSAFEGYRNHQDAAPIPWREANDTVNRIGGWKAYAREAQAAPAASPAPAPAAPSSAPAPAKDAAHSHHRRTAP